MSEAVYDRAVVTSLHFAKRAPGEKRGGILQAGIARRKSAAQSKSASSDSTDGRGTGSIACP
jgi:hypothetical protein